MSLKTPHEKTPVHGCYVVRLQPDAADERGELFRPFARLNMEGAGLEIDDLFICSRPGVLRGMHIQCATAPQWKYVRVVAGRIHGVVIDTSKVRHGERSYEAVLSARTLLTGPDSLAKIGLLIPPWCAWGYYSTANGSEVSYRIWGRRVVESERAIHYRSVSDWGGYFVDQNEPVLSERDRNALPLSEVDTGW